MKIAELEETIGYSLRLSLDDKTITVTLRAEEPYTNRALIEDLRALADELEFVAVDEEDRADG